MHFSLIFLLFLGLDIFSIAKVGGWLGVLPTLGLLLLGVMLGGAVLNMQKRRLTEALRNGLSGGNIGGNLAGPFNGLAIFLAGGLFIFPGFFSDCLALLLLFPPIRILFFIVFGQMLIRRLAPRLQRMQGFGPFGPFASGAGGFADNSNSGPSSERSGFTNYGPASSRQNDDDIIEGEFRDVTDLRDRNPNQTAIESEKSGPESGREGR